MTILFFLFFLLILFAMVAGGIVWKVVTQTVNKSGELWVNLEPIICPQCGENIELSRPPTLQKEPTWGGGACPYCGCEMDKWGNVVLQLTEQEKIAKQLEALKITPINTFDKDGKTPLERVFEENK